MEIDLEILERFALATREEREVIASKVVAGSEAQTWLQFLLAEQSGFTDATAAQHVAEWTRSRPGDRLSELNRARRILLQCGNGSSATPERLKNVASWLTEKLGLRFDDRRPPDDFEPEAARDQPRQSLPLSAPEYAPEVLLSAAIAKGGDNAFAYLNRGVYAEECEAYIAAITASDTKLVTSLINGGGLLPDIDPAAAVALVARALSCSYTQQRQLGSSVLSALPQLTLWQLRALRRVVPDVVCSPGVEMQFVHALLCALAPRSGVNFRTDKRALREYLRCVMDELVGFSPSLGPVRATLAYHTLALWVSELDAEACTRPGCSGAARELLTPGSPIRGVLEGYLAYPRADIAYAKETTQEARAAVGFGQGRSVACARALAVPQPTPSEENDLVKWLMTRILSEPAHAVSTASSTAAALMNRLLSAPSSSNAPDASSSPSSVAAADAALSPWSAWLSLPYLKSTQAEARLQRGTDADRDAAAAWAQRLSPYDPAGALQSLSDRVHLALLQRQLPEYLDARASFTLLFEAKNIERVEVRVYEISTTAYYADAGAEISTDIDLDGLVPHEKYVLRVGAAAQSAAAAAAPSGGGTASALQLVSQPSDGTPLATSSSSDGSSAPPSPLLMHSVALPLASLSVPGVRGVFVVEIVGGGQSCRCLVRKGSVRFLERRSVAGHAFTLLDESNGVLPPGRVSITTGGRRFAPLPGASEIIIPYGVSAAACDLILTLEPPTAQADEAAAASAAAAPVPAGVALPLQNWSFSCLHRGFMRLAEQYTLEAAFFVEREALLRDNFAAQVLLRPRLLLPGSIPCPLAALLNPVLTLTCVDGAGSTSQRLFRGLQLSADTECVVSFSVPPAASSLSFDLTADVEIVANGSIVSLRAATHTIELNGIDTTDRTRALFLRNVGGAEGFVLTCLGKAGEPVPNAPIALDVSHALLRESVHVNAVTDGNGAVVLGPLRGGFTRILARGADGSTSASFVLPTDAAAYATTVHTTAAAAPAAHTAAAVSASVGAVQAQVPFRPEGDRSRYTLTRRDVSLKEWRPVLPTEATSVGTWGDDTQTPQQQQQRCTADWFSAAEYDASMGCVTVRGLPEGEYRLVVKRPFPNSTGPAPTVTIRVLPPLLGPSPSPNPAATTTDGYTVAIPGPNYLAAGGVALQTRGVATAAAPLQLASITMEGSDLVIRVAGGASGCTGPALGRDVRVHVIPSVFTPCVNAGDALADLSTPPLGVAHFANPRSRYLSGRTLGEEQRYVIDRAALVAAGRTTQGMLLPRPTLLLNPMSLGPVSTDVVEAKAGTSYASMSGGAGGSNSFSSGGGDARMMRRGGGGPYGSPGGASSGDTTPNMDFLARPSRVLVNLRPSMGEVRVPLSSLVNAAAASSAADGATTTATTTTTTTTALSLAIVAVDAQNVASSIMPLRIVTTSSSSATATSVVSASTAVSCSADIPPIALRDLTAAAGALDADEHFIETTRVSSLLPGAAVQLSAMGTRVEAYGSLDRAFGLLSAAGGNRLLAAEFGWWLKWPLLNHEERCSRYSRYGCSETSLFLFFHAPAFFEAVVAPFLHSKRSKSFIDHWCLGHDVRAYAAPHAFARLNALERALLAARLEPAAALAAAGSLRDIEEASPLPRPTRDALFAQALASNGLEGREASEDALVGLLAEAEAAQRAQRRSEAAPAPMPPPPQPMMAMTRGMGVMRQSAVASPGAPQARRMMAKSAAAPMAMMMAMPMAPMAAAATSFGGSMSGDILSMDYSAPEAAQEESDMAARGVTRDAPSYRPLDKTEEYVEQHYYKTQRGAASAGDGWSALVPPNGYWADFAEHCAKNIAPTLRVPPTASTTSSSSGSSGGALQQQQVAPPAAAAAAWDADAVRAATHAAIALTPFVSGHFAQCTSSLNASLCALSVLGLPLERDVASPPSPPAIALSEGGTSLRYGAASSPLVVFYKDVTRVGAPPASSVSQVLCGQSFYDPADRYETSRSGVQTEKSIPPGELRPGRVYGCLITVSNLSSSSKEVDVLCALPRGCMPCNASQRTRTWGTQLNPYSTATTTYTFYLPRPGAFPHFPAHVSVEGELVACAPSTPIIVSAAPPPRRDTTSWRAVSTHGTGDDVLRFLHTANSVTTDLQLVMWRCRADEGWWRDLIALLRSRQWFHPRVWEYGVLYSEPRALSEYLSSSAVVPRISPILLAPQAPLFTSPLLRLRGEDGVGASEGEAADAVPLSGGAGPYEHMEYSPLINARVHVLGSTRRVPNRAVARQWRTLLAVIATKATSEITPTDLQAVTYHLLLADRVDAARDVFKRVTPPPHSVAAAHRSGIATSTAPSSSSNSASSATSSSWCTLQYDYMAAYLDLCSDNATAASGNGSGGGFGVARAVSDAYTSSSPPVLCAVPRWVALFTELRVQLDEATGGSVLRGATAAPAPPADGLSALPGLSSELSRESAQSRSALTASSLSMRVEDGAVILSALNVRTVRLSLFRMDIELLFSSSPFAVAASAAASSDQGGAKEGSGRFAFVRPNAVLTVTIPALTSTSVVEHRVPLPAEFARDNVHVSAASVGSGTPQRCSSPYYATRMHVSISQSDGRLRVTDAATGARLKRVYVKVYWRGGEGGSAKFLKDCYTDLRGVADYASVSTDELSRAGMLAVLVLSETHGAVARSVPPPRV